MTAPLLRIPGISARADGAPRPLLDAVRLTVAPGTVVAVVGPSGSGKTTLGLAALGAARPAVDLTGRVLLDGTDLLTLTPDARRAARAGRAAHLPQHPESVLDPVRRVGAVLTELAALGHTGRAARRTAAADALTAAGLDRATTHRRFPHQLSGGQQQRLALASALVTGARLLVLDEPTSGLDPALAQALGRTVRQLADDGAGILLLSHDLPLVRRTADRVTVLEHGRAVDEGPTPDILGSTGPGTARHPATRALLTAERRTDSARRAAAPPTSPPSAPDRGVVAEGVVVRRGTGSLLAGPVSLALPPGSSTALLGPSGSGKTTFARVLAGLTGPTSGEVRLDGAPLPARIDRRDTTQRRAVQYVHQSSPDSFEKRRPLIGQLADTGRLLRGLSRAEAAAEVRGTAERLGLEAALLDRVPGQLSGGQLQRCALVRALAARPALLVCDEVTSALDTASRERVLDALPRLLAPSATALLFISHDLPAARVLADDAVLFEAGRLVSRTSLASIP
ncbi:MULTISPECIES: ATP-binding cassette domain-containing protein [unclassified Streptomyces]|uniref:ABC transporter ATP-binding protein n=1 Tax=unclassified Streptomyces TaxID=2593676 RepID=UPI000DB99446|nr:ATP-binding cassette domain-containing protein [Streptomyces sp. PsTaAH-137]MYT75765.1 ATP-binding cassette domain-containing protein [Streptomyces sp. SID8367]RAJ87176.1 peptide/nickel transport system ATP-binding protein [Streptomyces sp. PsTaAH-137]